MIAPAVGLVLFVPSGCLDPAETFIAHMDRQPAAEQVPNWPQTKRLMQRAAPRVGDPAPDFTLATVEGGQSITRSSFQAGKPLVLIFGSFT